MLLRGLVSCLFKRVTMKKKEKSNDKHQARAFPIEDRNTCRRCRVADVMDDASSFIVCTLHAMPKGAREIRCAGNCSGAASARWDMFGVGWK